MEKRRLRIAVSSLELWKRDPPLWRAVRPWPDFHAINSNVPSLAAFYQLEILYFWIAAHLLHRLNPSSALLRAVDLPSLRARAFRGSTTPPICKPKSPIEERNKAPAYFRMSTLRLSFLLSTLQTVSPHHFISQALLIRLHQNADSPYESGDPIMYTTL